MHISYILLQSCSSRRKQAAIVCSSISQPGSSIAQERNVIVEFYEVMWSPHVWVRFPGLRIT